MSRGKKAPAIVTSIAFGPHESPTVREIAPSLASSGEFVGDLGPNERTDVRRGPY